jgi:hypothetical protein
VTDKHALPEHGWLRLPSVTDAVGADRRLDFGDNDGYFIFPSPDETQSFILSLYADDYDGPYSTKDVERFIGSIYYSRLVMDSYPSPLADWVTPGGIWECKNGDNPLAIIVPADNTPKVGRVMRIRPIDLFDLYVNDPDILDALIPQIPDRMVDNRFELGSKSGSYADVAICEDCGGSFQSTLRIFEVSQQYKLEHLTTPLKNLSLSLLLTNRSYQNHSAFMSKFADNGLGMSHVNAYFEAFGFNEYSLDDERIEIFSTIKAVSASIPIASRAVAVSCAVQWFGIALEEPSSCITMMTNLLERGEIDEQHIVEMVDVFKEAGNKEVGTFESVLAQGLDAEIVSRMLGRSS